MKRTKYLTLLLLLCFGFSMMAYASTEKVNGMRTIGLTPNIPAYPEGELGFRGVLPPDKSLLYSNNTWHTVSGTSKQSDLFTEKCFYGVTKVEYSIANYRSETLTQKLHRYLALIGYIQVNSSQISANSSSVGSYTGLEDFRYYFLEYSGPVDAHGKIMGTP